MKRRTCNRQLFIYRRLLTTARKILTKKVRRRIKLNRCFNQIVNQFSIDYSNEEMKDIQTAVFEHLKRLTEKINERGPFKIIRIQPSGSMEERTSLWKEYEEKDRDGTFNTFSFTEFDFLGVLQVPDTCKFCPVASCLGCMKVSGCQLLNTHLIHKYRYSQVLDDTNYERYDENYYFTIGECFTEELESAVKVALSCDCYSAEKNDEYDFIWAYDFSLWAATGCDKCSVSRPTGQLRIIRKRPSDNCSLALIWTSNVNSLLAPVSNERTYKMQRLQHLKIDVDFLPALELFYDVQKSKHKCFLVPKTCPHQRCDGWRISHCLAEIDHFCAKISCEHKKCYKVLKRLFQFDEVPYFVSLQITPYSIKTAVLNHSITCFDSSQSCADCVFNILRELKEAVRSGILTVFHGQANLFQAIGYAELSTKCIGHLLNLLSKFKSWKSLRLEYKKQASKTQARCI